MKGKRFIIHFPVIVARPNKDESGAGYIEVLLLKVIMKSIRDQATRGDPILADLDQLEDLMERNAKGVWLETAPEFDALNKKIEAWFTAHRV